MTEFDPIDIIGTLMRVVHVDDVDDTLYFSLPDGRFGRASGLGRIDLLTQGETIIINGHDWVKVPASTWIEQGLIAIVRRVLDDGTVLVDSAGVIRNVKNGTGADLSVNNTVEFNESVGIVRVVSEDPVRGGLGQDVDIDDIRRDYLWESSSLSAGFSDFGGYPDVKDRARELIETQLERRKKLDKINARPVKGVLFSGPPGTGKTHLARIIARESKADFYLVSGPSVVSKWVGDTEDVLRKIFEAATSSESGRAIIFFDEIDSIAERRGADSHESSRRLVAQLLTLMDGFDDKGRSVIVIAATNRVEALDPALTRPGRFDWEIEFGIPTLEDRREILMVRARHLRTSGDLPFEDVAFLTEGWSAADLTAIWTEAALVAAGEDRSAISAEDFAQAYERVASKPQRSALKGVRE